MARAKKRTKMFIGYCHKDLAWKQRSGRIPFTLAGRRGQASEGLLDALGVPLLVVVAMTVSAWTLVHSTALQHGAAPPQADRPASIQLSTYVGLLRSVSVTVANTSHPFIFDTGGGETMITPELASAIGCKPYGRAVGFRASGEQVTFQYCDDVQLRLGEVGVVHERVGVFDLASILPREAPPADGVVSLRSFRGRAVTIDLGKGTLTIETARSLAARTSGMRPLTIRVATGPTGAETTVYIAARAGGQRTWLLLDSGNGDPALVAPHVARLAGIENGRGEAVLEVDGLGTIRLPARTRNIIYDGMLGAALMQKWVFTLDLASSRAWASPVTPSKS